jgi:adenylylsulfate kinase-like enzyme
MQHKSPVVWLTGMSGSGKTTLANKLKIYFDKRICAISIIDGDSVRDSDKKQLGFGMQDVRINNTRIALLCNKQREEFDLVIVPVISPYNKIREEVREVLNPDFHLVYLKTDINSLKGRDPKGLYAAADRGDINDLIGYSKINLYDEPNNPELIVPTTSKISPDESFNILLNYITEIVLPN